MTRVCLVGEDDVNLQYELLSRETAREALAAYDLREPFENAIAVETVSLGAAVALLNDLEWYLVRFVDDALVMEPSVSEIEWLSKDLATAVRDNEKSPSETDRYLKVYGLEQPSSDETQSTESEQSTNREQSTDAETQSRSGNSKTEPSPPRLVEPMLVARTGETIPEYDLRDVSDTVVVRVSESEFGA